MTNPKMTPAKPRRWERRASTMPISLVLKNGNLKADDSATTLDISLRGAKVRTKLTLRPGDLVGVVPQGEFPEAIRTRVIWVREYESNDWTLAGLEFLSSLQR